MKSNFREVVNKTGFYSAEILNPPGTVLFHVHTWLSEVEVAPASGPETKPFRISIDKLMNVRYVHNFLKSLPKSE